MKLYKVIMELCEFSREEEKKRDYLLKIKSDLEARVDSLVRENQRLRAHVIRMEVEREGQKEQSK